MDHLFRFQNYQYTYKASKVHGREVCILIQYHGLAISFTWVGMIHLHKNDIHTLSETIL